MTSTVSAISVLQHYSGPDMPVDPFAIAERVGCEVIPGGNDNIRDRFMMARRLGYHFNPYASGAFVSNWAASLLIPAEALRDYVYGEKIQSIDALSEIFNVSGYALEARMKELGML